MVSMSGQHVSSLAHQVRERFVSHMVEALPDTLAAVQKHLTGLLEQPGPAHQVQFYRDSCSAFQRYLPALLAQTREALLQASAQRLAQPEKPPIDTAPLELVAEQAMDDEVIASRMAMRVLDLAGPELQALRLRIQHLEKRQALQRSDVLRPDVLIRIVVEQWHTAHLSREAWSLVQETMSARLAEQMGDAYRDANAFLVDSGVMPEIDLQALVRRSPDNPSPTLRPEPARTAHRAESFAPLTSPGTPLARARMRAQGVVSRLRERLIASVGHPIDAGQAVPPSPALQAALDQRPAPVPTPDQSMSGFAELGSSPDAHAQTLMDRALHDLHARTVALKQVSSTSTERATIEVVALMFQSILAEDRIPPSMRLLFARLQMPVLRVALTDPDFFDALQHPARHLIDRMGSCAMGFESHAGMAALEAEISRIVQMIEQYPETGRRVFELVLEEFQTFLSAYLSEQGSASRYVSMAQQVEEKETLAVQYTIELRKLLDGLSVRDEVRDFLFKVWVDVLALASVRYGPQQAETLALKQVASDLLWMASAKPGRSDRSRVIQQLPALLQRLRKGMDLLGLAPELQDRQVKLVSDTLAQAFMLRTPPIPQERLDQLSERLGNLEAYLPDEGGDDLSLDKASIELITGVDASHLVVITQGGQPPSAAMREWAIELQLGDWFDLQHQDQQAHVQLAWRSQRGQLCLFVGGSGLCCLMPLSRVAAYLQSGLLVPSEDEALTVRATRHALAQIEAEPQRLFS